jgi:hypothetical protein
MSLPKQIQKQVTAAQEIIDSYEKAVGTDETANTEDSVNQTTDDNENADSGTDSSAQATQQVSTQPAGEDENSPTYKQRWKTLEGQLRAAAARDQQWQQRVQHLEQLIATMQVAPPVQQPAKAAAVTDEDREAFGEDLVDLISRSTKATLEAENESLRRAVADLSQSVRTMQTTLPQVVQNQQVTADERFFSQLGASVPDWAQINNNPQFIEWLKEVDPMTNITRQTYIADAQSTHDVLRVANIFNTWKSLVGITQTQQQGKTQAKSAKAELERQVAPSRSLSTAPAANSSDKQVWSSSLVRQFYDDVRRGAYKGREAERISLERDIFAAQNEGRFNAAA